MADEDEINSEKVKKFGAHSVAPESSEDLRKQKSYKKRWIFQWKRFQSASFMCQKKVLWPSIYILFL